MILSVVFATIVPIFGIATFAKSEGLDYDIPERHARAMPFEIAILSYLAGFSTLVTLRSPVLVTGLMLAYLINTTAMFLVTLAWKISVHAAGVTGPLTFLVFRLGPAWGLLYLLVIPVGLIRLWLGQHTWTQVLAGAVLSAALTWAEIIFLVPLIPH
jgi:membrane-associated phospholipid phosphatase